MVEVSFAAAKLTWQSNQGGVIGEASNWSPEQIPAETNEVDITQAQSAPITLVDDFHVYLTKLSANSSGAEMVIDMGGHEYLNETSIETYNNTVYVFTNGTLKIATNSEKHSNLIKTDRRSRSAERRRFISNRT